jgi:hypothetical protein
MNYEVFLTHSAIQDKASVSQLTKLETDIKGKADTKRVTDLEEAISEKTNVSQVEDLISTAIAGANASAAQSTSSSEIEESVNRKVVELRDSTMLNATFTGLGLLSLLFTFSLFLLPSLTILLILLK